MIWQNIYFEIRFFYPDWFKCHMYLNTSLAHGNQSILNDTTVPVNESSMFAPGYNSSLIQQRPTPQMLEPPDNDLLNTPKTDEDMEKDDVTDEPRLDDNDEVMEDDPKEDDAEGVENVNYCAQLPFHAVDANAPVIIHHDDPAMAGNKPDSDTDEDLA